MKHKRLKGAALVGMILTGLLVMPASAMDYQIDGVKQTEFYGSTLYEDVYGAEYQYGGPNVSDYAVAEMPYGTFTAASIGVLDKVTADFTISYAGTSFAPILSGGSYIQPSTPSYTPVVPTTQFTSVADVLKSNGTLGTLRIPALKITATVKPDETMSYSVGHISSTSAWAGNVGICGHNRGSSVIIGDIKDLELGDAISYTTQLGTRNYSVTSVKQISSTDWSDLTATSDNRITLITCVKDAPNLRWCVIATEN